MAKQTKETTERAQEPVMGTDKDMFDLLDEVEANATPSMADVAVEAEAEIAKEMGDDVSDEEANAKSDAEAKAKETEETVEEEVAEEEETDEEEEVVAEESEEETEEEEDEAEEEEKETVSETPSWLTDKVKELNPDLDMTDTEAVQEAVDRVFESSKEAEKLREDLAGEKEANQEFYNLLEGSAELQNVVKFMYKNEADLASALMAFGIQPAQDMEALKKEDPDAYIEAVKNQEEAKKQAEAQEKKQEELMAKYEANEKKSISDFEAFKKDLKLDDKQIGQFTEAVNAQIELMSEGYTSKEFYETFYNGLRFEEAVEKARQEGIAEGRNTKIDSTKAKKQGDGLPQIKPQGEKPKAEKEKKDVFDKALEGGNFVIPE